MSRLRAVVSLLLLFLVVIGSVHAAPSVDKPFAEAKVVLQISDMDPSKQTLVLNVASNLLKHYGPDRVDIEVVAFGPGLRLLFADNVNKQRITTLAAEGVRFSACSNTIASFTTQLGTAPQINPVATKVPAGIVRIVEWWCRANTTRAEVLTVAPCGQA